jgi:uncharacterized membrane protein/uncharacterized membrane protein YeaQ/YmgE (transglycosylase-associated protein family)
MSVLTWILCGLAAGSIARIVTRAPRWGVAGDLALGLLGGVVGGWLFRLLGVAADGAGVAQLVVAGFGAAATIAAMRLADATFARAVALTRRAGAAPGAPSLETQVARLGELERRILAKVLRRERVARDPNAVFDEQLGLGDRVADRVASFGGSWSFLGIFAAIMLAWMAYNVETPRSFDPYPFILLNLVLSCLAAVQAPVIMMSQNRMAAKDRVDARHDFEVNLKAEVEIMKLHEKLDELMSGEWRRLLALQEQQIATLSRIENRAPGSGPPDA